MTGLRSLGLVAFLGLTWVGSAPAQPGMYGPGSGIRPAYSPYLNLARRGNPAINYYGLVRPEVDTRNAFQSLGQQLSQVRQDVATVDATGNFPLPATGYPQRFFDTGPYFRGAPTGQVGVRSSRPTLAGVSRPVAVGPAATPPRRR